MDQGIYFLGLDVSVLAREMFPTVGFPHICRVIRPTLEVLNEKEKADTCVGVGRVNGRAWGELKWVDDVILHHSMSMILVGCGIN